MLRKWTPWEGAPSVRRKYAGIQDHCHLGRWDLPFAIIVFPQCLKMGLPGAAFFLDVATPFLASSGIENEVKTCCGTGAGRIKNGSVWRARFWLCRICSTLPFIAHGGLVEQASVATISKAAMQQYCGCGSAVT